MKAKAFDGFVAAALPNEANAPNYTLIIAVLESVFLVRHYQAIAGN